MNFDGYDDPMQTGLSRSQWDKMVENVNAYAANLGEWTLKAMDAVREGDYDRAYAIYKAVHTAAENLQTWTYLLMVYELTDSVPAEVNPDDLF